MDIVSEQHIVIVTLRVTGSLIMESIEKQENLPIAQLRLAESSTQRFVMGSIVYIIIYRDRPIGIKFESRHFAHVMHLFMDSVPK